MGCDRESRRKPQRLQTDLEKEFSNAPFLWMLEREVIDHSSTHADAKASFQSHLEIRECT